MYTFILFHDLSSFVSFYYSDHKYCKVKANDAQAITPCCQRIIFQGLFSVNGQYIVSFMSGRLCSHFFTNTRYVYEIQVTQFHISNSHYDYPHGRKTEKNYIYLFIYKYMYVLSLCLSVSIYIYTRLCIHPFVGAIWSKQTLQSGKTKGSLIFIVAKCNNTKL